MKIQDYELVNNVGVLFEKKIIIYGVGKYGIRSAKFLEKAGVGIYCFVTEMPDGSNIRVIRSLRRTNWK